LMYPDRARRTLAIAAGVLAIVVPLALQLLGVIPTSYAFTSHEMVIRPLLVDLPPGLTTIILLLANVTPIVVVSFAVGQLRDALSYAEERIHTQAWQLRQLLPSFRSPGRPKSETRS